jgi:hypothetical protein
MRLRRYDQRAVQLFPNVSALLSRKRDDQRADALLIAAYGMQVTVERRVRETCSTSTHRAKPGCKLTSLADPHRSCTTRSLLKVPTADAERASAMLVDCMTRALVAQCVCAAVPSSRTQHAPPLFCRLRRTAPHRRLRRRAYQKCCSMQPSWLLQRPVEGSVDELLP